MYNKYVIFDLDETLVHTFFGSAGYSEALACSEIARNLFKLNMEGSPWGVVRNFASLVLEELKTAGWGVLVWSAGDREYVDAVVKAVFPFNPVLVWSRRECDNVYSHEEGQFIRVKPLEKMWNSPVLAPLRMTRFNTLIVDDKDEVCTFNPANHVKIKAFAPTKTKLQCSKEQEDQSLVKLCDLLKLAFVAQDVRVLTSKSLAD
jgi:hypothetical protein